jgi:hypothetical protein
MRHLKFIHRNKVKYQQESGIHTRPFTDFISGNTTQVGISVTLLHVERRRLCLVELLEKYTQICYPVLLQQV